MSTHSIPLFYRIEMTSLDNPLTLPPNLIQQLTLSSYRTNFMVQKIFETLKFDCTI